MGVFVRNFNETCARVGKLKVGAYAEAWQRVVGALMVNPWGQSLISHKM